MGLTALASSAGLRAGCLPCGTWGPSGSGTLWQEIFRKITSFTILVFFKGSSQKFKFLYVPLPTALPHLGPTGTSKPRKGGGRGQSPGLPAARSMPLVCRGIAGNRSNAFSPRGRPAAPTRCRAAHPTQSHEGTGSLGFIAPTQEEMGTHALAFCWSAASSSGQGPAPCEGQAAGSSAA